MLSISLFHSPSSSVVFRSYLAPPKCQEQEKKKLEKKKEREREAAQARLHRENSASTELGRRRAWTWRDGKDFGSSTVPGLSLVPAALRWAWLCPLRVLPCPWSAPGWPWELGLVILRDWEQQGDPSQSSFAAVPILVPISPALASPRAVTDRRAWDGHWKPSLFPFHHFWEQDGPGAASHRKGDGSSPVLQGHLSLD